MKLKWLKSKYIQLPEVLRIFIVISIMMMVFGYCMHLIEPETFDSFVHVLWWETMTFTTIGYGDIVPKSKLGQICSILIIYLATGFVTYFYMRLAKHIMLSQFKDHYGKAIFKGDQHMIIVGWNERTKKIIESYRSQHGWKNPIVLVDHTLKESQLDDTYFIKGKPYEDETMMHANIKEAKQIIITADPNALEQDADIHTIMTLLTVKGLNPKIYAIAEILTSSQMDNAKRAGADQIIQTSELTTKAIVNSLNIPDH
ncbi:potassium channel protein [Terrilactibacillus sp. BCM23-1]|uniref:Potassium channel protein n=1 Tax=Terrilactibacillus tamarindi TaxID=2599694 RepID=A0A6N8CN72_9BACI|nr:potassium channel family protein [Terrilactibacillus tamarindi]MTT30647.1 potassium channel protein [Terrilactibacillus tamarindi]